MQGSGNFTYIYNCDRYSISLSVILCPVTMFPIGACFKSLYSTDKKQASRKRRCQSNSVRYKDIYCIESVNEERFFIDSVNCHHIAFFKVLEADVVKIVIIPQCGTIDTRIWYPYVDIITGRNSCA